jgi:hypothetical protein
MPRLSRRSLFAGVAALPALVATPAVVADEAASLKVLGSVEPTERPSLSDLAEFVREVQNRLCDHGLIGNGEGIGLAEATPEDNDIDDRSLDWED